jgi:TRAP-type C4-dicarboxylate transport system permease small subunit
MKKRGLILLFAILCSLATSQLTHAQCSICTKSVQQLGEKPAKALNAGILYLAFTPLAIFGYIGYRWWKNNLEEN